MELPVAGAAVPGPGVADRGDHQLRPRAAALRGAADRRARSPASRSTCSRAMQRLRAAHGVRAMLLEGGPTLLGGDDGRRARGRAVPDRRPDAGRRRRADARRRASRRSRSPADLELLLGAAGRGATCSCATGSASPASPAGVRPSQDAQQLLGVGVVGRVLVVVRERNPAVAVDDERARALGDVPFGDARRTCPCGPRAGSPSRAAGRCTRAGRRRSSPTAW